MMRLSPVSPPAPVYLEALEARIAPAVIVIGDPSLGAQSYTSEGTDFRAAGNAFPGLDFGQHHYYLDLVRGDSVSVASQQGNTIDFIKLTGRTGAAFAFFYDKNFDGNPTVDELTGLSLAAGTNIAIKGNVDGDVVANRDAAGNLVVGSLISDRQTILAFSANNVGTNNGADGKIIAGGNVSNVSVGAVKVIQSGTPDYGSPDQRQYNFGGTQDPVIGTLQEFDPGARRAGGNVVNVTAASVDYILAGLGGVGGVGGNITNVLVTADADGLTVRAGDGGDDGRGGRGGSVTQVVIAGVETSVANVPLRVLGGEGGGNGTGNGGAGGNVTNIWVGYEYSSTARTSIIESTYAVKSNILIEGGQGGSGVVAGAGGSLRGLNVFADTPDKAGVVHEIVLRGGDGGEVPSTARSAGAGGAVSLVKVKNIDIGTGVPGGLDYSDILIAGGNASAAAGLSPGALPSGRGAAGGTVSNPVAKPGQEWLIGASFTVEGGLGSDAQAGGGKGGAVSNLSFQPFSALYLRDLRISGGVGGSATSGAGGAGGAISGVAVPVGDLRSFSLFGGAGGGSLAGRAGGVGGAVTSVDVFDFDPNSPERITTLAAMVTGGSGGDGFRSGGVGGSLKGISLFSTAALLEAKAGDGGNATGVGRVSGGAGGQVSSLAFLSARSSDAAAPTETATIVSGVGGDGRGSGSGGAGGAMSRINIEVPGEVIVRAGDGGRADAGGRTGGGGSIGGTRVDAGLSASSILRSVDVSAGSGGDPLVPAALPAAGGGGGSVTNVVISAPRSLAVSAGDGAAGGSGGSGGKLNTIGFYGQVVSGSPEGDVVLRAGHGGDATTDRGRSGAGGSITKAAGFTSDAIANLSAAPPNSLQVAAGRGGSGGSLGGVGGSVSGLSLLGGFAPFSVIAGDGGDGRGGGAGGGLLNIASAVKGVALALAAGDGGDGNGGRAGVGGSVDRVDVIGDIGTRTGKAYGFATDGSKMGGIFAGRGGVSGALEASAGRVTNITAQAIAAIVAGRGDSPYLASLVDSIYLRGNEAVTRVETTLPNVVENVVSATGSGAAGGVLGDGSELTMVGSYNGALEINLRTAGGVFDGVSVVYIDVDGIASGIRSTDEFRLLPLSNAGDDLASAVTGKSSNAATLSDTFFRSILDFDSAFRPEFALAFSSSQAVLYEISSAGVTPVTTTLSVVTAGEASSFSLLLSDLGLSSKVPDGFNFAATYLAGLSQINTPQPMTPPPLTELPGAYRTNQSIGFAITGGDPGSGIEFTFRPELRAELPASAFVVPVTRVPSYLTFTQALANFVGGKSGDPLAPGAENFLVQGAPPYQPNANGPATTEWSYGNTRPMDGLIAATTLTAKRNFMPLAFLTNVTGGNAELYLPTIPSAR